MIISLVVSREIIEKRINLIVDENSMSFELFNINTIVLNEENLFKKKEHKTDKDKESISVIQAILNGMK